MSSVGVRTSQTRGRFLATAASALGTLLLPAGRARAGASVPTDGAVLQFTSRPDLAAPTISILKSVPPLAPGYVFLAPMIGPGQHGPLVVDSDGEPVWIAPHPRKQTHNLRVQTLAGKPVLTWWEGDLVLPDGYGHGQFVIADTSYREIHRFSPANGYSGDLHEFTLTSRGTAIVSIYNEVKENLSSWGAGANGSVLDCIVQELDIRTRKVLLEWHSHDHVGLVDSYRDPVKGQPWDYFHLNSIAPLGDGNLLVSSRHTSTIYKVDRRTGKVIWRLGGRQSDFDIPTNAAFSFQHHARGHPGNLVSIFDNASYSQASATEPTSRALVLKLDTHAMTATLVRANSNPQGALSVAMGSVQVLGDGGMFVGWGTMPTFSEFSASGDLRYDANLVGLGTSYRAFRQRWKATPLTRPAIATVRNSDGTLDVFTSWNGATEVAQWQLLGGSDASALDPVRTVPRAGFETQVQLATTPGFVASVALDAHGKELGRSNPLRT